MLLEIACFSLESAILAAESGAHRIELCSAPLEGGLTPSVSMIKLTRKYVSIPFFVMIRPREGDFLYSEKEFEMMMNDIRLAKDYGADGVVLGILKPDGDMDIDRISRLVLAAAPMQVTIHRAFDLTRDPYQAMENIIQTGAHRILTSGQKATAMEGRSLISVLVKQAAARITIMPGSGVNAGNIASLRQETGAVEFHASARKITDGNMQYTNPNLSLHAGTDLKDNSIMLPNREQIEKMLASLQV